MNKKSKIFRSNEAHFKIDGTVNIYNYRIWIIENLPIHIRR